MERCKSKYSVVCSSLNAAVWSAGRRFVTIARNLPGSSVCFGVLGGTMHHDLELLIDELKFRNSAAEGCGQVENELSP